MKLTKAHIGQKVLLLSVGCGAFMISNTSYADLKEVVLTSMKRTKGVLAFESNLLEINFYTKDDFPNSIYEKEDYQHLVFESVEEYAEFKLAHNMKCFLSSRAHSLSTEQLLGISKVLGAFVDSDDKLKIDKRRVLGIKTEKEPDGLTSVTSREKCVFCNSPTPFWHEETNSPVCNSCSEDKSEHDLLALVWGAE